VSSSPSTLTRVRRRWVWFLAALLTACSASTGAPKRPASGATRPLTWQRGVHIPGVFDIAGPRRDGRFVVAVSGHLALFDRATETVSGFAPAYSSPPGIEAYIAMSPGLAVDGQPCRFDPDEVAALDATSAPPGVILISPGGVASRLASISSASALVGIAFDTVGRFGHRLLVAGPTARPGQTQISAVDCQGKVSTIGDVAVPLEGGMTVAPPTFGAFAGQLIAANELDGTIYAISPTGRLQMVARSGLPAAQDIGVESVGFVPAPGPGTAYLADRVTAGGIHPGTDTLLRLDGQSLASAGVGPGDLLAGTEGGASVVDVRCESACSTHLVVPIPTASHGEGHLLVLPP
jgi:hypothetical protein